MSTYRVELWNGEDRAAWDEYVHGHRQGRFFHLAGWETVVKEAYGQPTVFWVCRQGERIVGVLPMVHLQHFLLGNSLVSMPYLDGGGILADNEQVWGQLLTAAAEFARSRQIPQVELRNFHPEPWEDQELLAPLAPDKVQMLIPLPASADALFKSFSNKNKVRTVVRKAEKSGLSFVWGGPEKLPDFYGVFAANMRDLGSPAHSQAFFHWIFRVFSDYLRLGIVSSGGQAIAAGIVVGCKDTLSFPWGGSLRTHHHLNPFPLLVWELLREACRQGYRFFDFGRSSRDSGPYQFKARWGAQPHPLHWRSLRRGAASTIWESRRKFDLVSKIWRRLPLALTNLVGPRLLKHISL